MPSLKTTLLLLAALLTSGCASVIHGDNQSMRVSTFCGQQLAFSDACQHPGPKNPRPLDHPMQKPILC